MFLDSHGDVVPHDSTVGARAAAVPGTVMGLALAEQKYGRLSLARVMAPAIRLARNGFPIREPYLESLRPHHELLEQFDGSRHIFLRDGKYYQLGAIFRQPDLCSAPSAAIAQHGPQGFYSGPTAQAIVATMRKYHGLITQADLDHYEAKLRTPLTGHFRGFEILSTPPPSAGGTMLIEMLNILDPLDLASPNSYPAMHLIAETMRRVYADRASYLGDADFTKVPVEQLTSLQHSEILRKQILESPPETPVTASDLQVGGSRAPQRTIQWSMPRANAVSNTYTLNGWFGCGVTVEGAGFLLNNEMDDFTSKPGAPNLFGLVQGEANAIAPYKRPLSSTTPTMVLKDGKLRLVLGSPGGSTITNTVLQVLLNVLVYKMDVLQAVSAPRFHDQWSPDKVELEREGFSSATIERLRQAGYPVSFRDNMGDCEAIEVDPQSGVRYGASDPRGDGKAVGY